MIKRIRRVRTIRNEAERQRFSGWTRRHWRRYARARAIECAEKAAWWAEAAEKADNYTESQKCAFVSQSFAATSSAFMGAR